MHIYVNIMPLKIYLKGAHIANVFGAALQLHKLLIYAPGLMHLFYYNITINKRYNSYVKLFYIAQ